MVATKDETMPIRASEHIIWARQAVRLWAIEREFSLVDQTKLVTAATELAGRLGFSRTGAGNVAVVVTEAATNLVKHATAGEILLYALQCGQIGGIEALALDRGPGIANVAKCLRDGYSTTGSPGTGL